MLNAEGHFSKTYGPTGSSTLNDSEKTAILSRVLGPAISCVEVPIAAFLKGMKDQGVPEAERFKLGEAFGKIIELGDEPPYVELERFLGERPQSFEEWCLLHREDFR